PPRASPRRAGRPPSTAGTPACSRTARSASASTRSTWAARSSRPPGRPSTAAAGSRHVRRHERRQRSGSVHIGRWTKARGRATLNDMAAPIDQDEAPAAPPLRMLNRHLSWLDFDARVLALAEDEGKPLLERAKFLAIFSTNLDEFFQVRV